MGAWRLAPRRPEFSRERRRHFSIDCLRLGEGPTTKATATTAAAERWFGVCALVSEAQAEASEVAEARAVERMTAAAILS